MGLCKFILNLEQQLRRAEEKCEEAEARAKELEKQVKLGPNKNSSDFLCTLTCLLMCNTCSESVSTTDL
jgi:hypothetical protein